MAHGFRQSFRLARFADVSARALLYNKNYRKKSHYCLIVALKNFYVREGKISISMVEGLQRGKNLRENADYYDQWSKTGAEETIKLAKEFRVRSV